MKSSIGFMAMVLVMAITSFAIAADKVPNDGFKPFYTSLKKAVNSNNRQAISGVMSDQFQWAGDGTVSKKSALESMDSMKLWGTFKKALNTKPAPIVDSTCQQGECYAVWSKKPATGFIFKKAGGHWTWSELRGD